MTNRIALIALTLAAVVGLALLAAGCGSSSGSGRERGADGGNDRE
jgi:hypothetical protein